MAERIKIWLSGAIHFGGNSRHSLWRGYFTPQTTLFFCLLSGCSFTASREEQTAEIRAAESFVLMENSGY